jgi:hypothetical protein
VGSHSAGPGGRARDHGTAVPGGEQSILQARSSDDGNQAHLVPSGEEDAVGSHHGFGCRGVGGLFSSHGTEPGHPGGSHLREELAVPAGGLVSPHRGGAENHQTWFGSGQLDEARKHRSLPPFVLGAADDHDRSPGAVGGIRDNHEHILAVPIGALP